MYSGIPSDTPSIVIHLILSVEVGVAQVPALLRGEPQGDVENLGTQNYSKLPVAVILGKGYTDAEFKDMHEACQGESNIRWLRPDMATKAPDGEGYAKKMAEKMKTGLRKLADDGMMNQDGLYFF